MYYINRDMLAAQAQLVLARTAEGGTSAGIAEWSVLEEESAPPVRQPNFDVMTGPGRKALVDGLFAASTWFVDTSMWLLCHKVGTWDRDKLFNTQLEDWSPRRSSVFRQVAIVADPPSRKLLERAAASEHSADRNAARNAIAMVSDLDTDGAIRKKLAADPDMWVRGKLLADPAAPKPEYWTCPWCPTQNPMDVEDCSGWEYGVGADAQQ